jgi:hypothetical protein
MYSTLYQHEFNVCSSVKVCKELYVNGTIIGSMTGRSTRSSYILACWCNEEGTTDIECTDLTPHPGQIVNGCAHPYYFAKVNWFQQLPDSLRHYYGKPVEIWSSDIYVQDGPAMCIPIRRIKCRFVYAKTNFGTEM